ncbi:MULTISPECIES: SagB/ThcOx family dehydrogenase [unclassified Neisseria]|uniref:SagB/ThcOx family dehydrogenase n=1 Tax=unclassified Neisseria TaxID=2623750 RepID=UPI0026666E87|nr:MULTISPECIES: SagB/ThcOx family dehydrogenase [unclassified Neisseria]MDO1510222.1 SagB/ThcOx family dehydrogenase [Neisseria sp. MVDL19-042950]MDO1516391.1 SagB/ThcOx family dehydrogenase [Neisseria sp. MVDL18-041461]MDO1563539.1 SagB/ThcOx family dehydrogenase [Neisseria sp. MVDL20-010259]
MHELELNLAADYIDQSIFKDNYIFHSRSHNRENKYLAVVPRPMTYLGVEHLKLLEFPEHYFGGQILERNVTDFSPLIERKPSATFFRNDQKMTYKQLMTLLSQAFGESNSDLHTRPYPSGGGMYSGQVILYAKAIDGLDKGSYHFLPKSHKLERLNAKSEEVIEKHLFLGANEKFLDYSFFILYSIMPVFTIAKYGMRGYRLSCIEIGSMYQALIMKSEKMGLRSRVWGGFNDEQLSLTLGVDPRVVWPVVCHLVGWENKE